MHIKSIGHTGLQATPIGIGLAALGRPGYININHGRDVGSDFSLSKMESQTHEVLDNAWKNGIRYFDTARSYGKAEYFLSTWLSKRNIDPSEITVASKWGYVYTAEWSINAQHHEVKKHTLENLNVQWQESNELLAQYLNLYQIHSATLESGVLENVNILNRLSEIKSHGTKIGLSLSGPSQSKVMLKALQVRVDGERLFDTVQATWNLMETSAAEALTQAHDQGVGVILKETLANGRLLSETPNSSYDLQGLMNLARRLNCTLDALALALAIKQPFADVVLSGASTVHHLDSNLKALDVKLTLFHADEVSSLKQDALSYWHERSNLPWN